MATRITLLNDDNAVWNDRDFMTWYKDFVTTRGAGFLNVHRSIEHLQNTGFEEGTGNITASDWIGSDAFNSWYGFIAGTCTISLDTVEFDSGAKSLKIAQTVNDGSQVSGVRLTENASSFDPTDFRHLVPVNGGTDIRLGFALKTLTVAAGSGKGAQVAIQAYDENGDATGSEQTSTLVTGTQAFTDDTLDVTLPDDAKYIQITARIVNTTGTAWFDSFELTERGTDIELTAQDPAAATLDVATGVCFFEITDADTNTFLIRFEVEVAETITITNNATANPRIDTVYAFYDNAADLDVDGSNVGSIEIAVGTPAGSPVAPAVPANGFKIAEVYVAAGASVFNESTVTDSRVACQTRNIRFAQGVGSADAANMERVRAVATQTQPGAVLLNEAPADEERPRVITDQYAGLLTEAEKNSLLAGATNIGDALTAGSALLAGMNVSIESDGELYMTRPITPKSGNITTTNINTTQEYITSGVAKAYSISETVKLLIYSTSSGVPNIVFREITVNPVTGAYVSSTTDNVPATAGSFDFDFKFLSATTGIVVFTAGAVVYGVIVTGIGSGITMPAGATNLGACRSGSYAVVEAVSATEAVMIKQVDGTGFVSVKLGISGTTITVGTVSTFVATATSDNNCIAVRQISTLQHIFFYRLNGSSLTYAIIATYDTGTGAYTSIGTAVSTGEDISSYAHFQLEQISSTRFIMAFRNAASGVKVGMVSISGTVPTFNAYVSSPSAYVSGRVALIKYGLFHWGLWFSRKAQMMEIDLDGYDTVTFVGAEVDMGTDNGHFGVLLNSDNIITIYAEPSGTDDEIGVIPFTHNLDGYVGVTSAAAADGASIAFTSLGKETPYDTVAAGTQYRAKFSGQFTTEPTTYGWPIVGVGRADGDIQITQRAAA